jgi:hypothetical protein
VVVERGDGHVGGLGDVAQRGLGVALLGEHLDGRIDDVLAP